MRQSDQNNSSNFTVNTALSVSSTSQRRFAGHKISKVRFLNDLSEFSGRFVSGSWNIATPNQGCLTLWHADGQRAAVAGMESFQRRDRLFVGAGVDVNDIFVINSQQFVASMSNGDVKIVDCPIPESDAADEGKMCTIAEYPHVHKQAASCAICVLDNEIFSGSDSGNIVRIHPSGRASHAVRTFADDLMGVTGLCSSGQFLMVSSHSTGQLHLWDVRKRAMSPELGIEPLNSRPVTEVNNSITAIGVHPTQPNVITFGTQDGVVSFIDIRQTDQPLPIAFKVSQDPINELKFHPIFANNCFSLSDSGIIHWDGSMLARELSSVSFPAANGGDESAVNEEMEIMEEDGDAGNEHRNIWLSARASTSMQLRVLVEDEPKMLSTFDLAQGALLAASHTAELILITGVNFNN